ncbi:hypothetical protein RHAB21_01491 [Pseudorhizobium halotolerans]|uniref:DUF883 domain-containing protein n=1 Tax=Pseudorhizobium halotolerans TaxID=1233081 RepID=A0ABN7JH22_9HYPH|nr:hypothetical protein [Pseudorhizobium halotolerans]CAD7028292.1 hypothetical protein RHAB21_01491 [Pseudorhizobium halotolerans]
MAQDDESPAVRSIKKERAQQRTSEGKSELDEGLEDTFPASDPVAATDTAIAGSGGTARKASGNRQSARSAALNDEFPLVDEALQATREQADEADTQVYPGELHALKAEVARLRETVTTLASGTTRVAKARAQDALDDVELRIRERPWKAVGIAAVLGFFFGLRK